MERNLVLRQGDEKTVVQVKRYKRSVGVKSVQEAVASKEYYHGDKAMVVTNNYFSRQARTLAKANQVELWDSDDLVSRLLSSKEANSNDFASLTEGLPSERVALPPAINALATPICARCGTQVSAKVHEYCAAHADIFHGLTYCYDHQKEIRSFTATR